VEEQSLEELRKEVLVGSQNEFPAQNLLGKIYFDIGFHLNLPFSKTTYSCTLSADLFDCLRSQCVVESSIPSLSNVGSFTPFECSLTLPLNNNMNMNTEEEGVSKGRPAQIWFSVEVDRRFWLVHGLKKSNCQLLPGEKKNFQFKLLPLVAGMLPGPTLKVSVDEQPAVEIPNDKKIYVSPPKIFTSSLREKQ
jgi:hypothetical protein